VKQFVAFGLVGCLRPRIKKVANLRLESERVLAMWLYKSLVSVAVASAWMLVAAPAFSQTAPLAPAPMTAVVDAPVSAVPVPLLPKLAPAPEPALTPALAAKLSSQYSSLAGSTQNSQALVSGLRDGSPVTLVASAVGPNPPAPSATFTPATSPLGYGSINIALSLAKADLAKAGIANPTPSQLAAALNGGPITTEKGVVSLSGVLAQRQAGLGWGEIANAMGVKLGALVSAAKSNTGTQRAKSGTHHKAKKSGKAGKSRGKSQAGRHGGSRSAGSGGGSKGGHSAGGHGGGHGGGGKK
jgi:hypothetical protein